MPELISVETPVRAVPSEEEVTAEIIKAATVEAPEVTITPQTDLFKDLALDSLTLTSLVVGLEDRYQVLLNEQDAKEIKTVADLASLVVRRLKEQS